MRKSENIEFSWGILIALQNGCKNNPEHMKNPEKKMDNHDNGKNKPEPLSFFILAFSFPLNKNSV
jgi:hypothetical protein